MAEFKRAVNVIPLTRISLDSSQIFTYLVPLPLYDQLRPGQLVTIPFGKRMLSGVVSSFEMHRLEKEAKNLKELTKLLDPTPVVSQQNFALAEWLAGFYVSSLGLVLKTMLPKFAARSREPSTPGYEKSNPDFVLTEHQRQALNHITSPTSSAAKFLLFGAHGSGKTEVCLQATGRVLESQKQVLILLPEISLASVWVERLARRFGIENVALLHSGLPATEYWWLWQKIRNKEKQIIVGTRSAVFAPVQDLGLLIVDSEHDSSFKQADQNPKYDARLVAEKVAALWQCPLVASDETPSVGTYYQAMSRRLQLLVLPHRIKADTEQPKIQVVDLRASAARGEGSIFSEFLKLSILENLKAKRQVVLFLNRRGTAAQPICRDCGWVPACKDCSVSLSWHKERGQLICHYCGRSYALPEVCPKCQGTRIAFVGLGTEAAAEELKKLVAKEFGSRPVPVIARVDSDAVGSASASDELAGRWREGQIQVLIGTQMLGSGWKGRQVGLVGIVSADSLLYLPDFRAAERTFQLLTRIAALASGVRQSGRVILQTRYPDHYAIEALKLYDYERFFRSEIGQREKFNFPPFCRLVKLTIEDAHPETAKAKAAAILKKLAAKPKEGIVVQGPVRGFVPKVKNRHRFLVVLKIPPGGEVKLGQFLAGLPSDVDIDVDPEDLL